MAFAVSSDPNLAIVAWTAVALFGASLACLLASLLLRWQRQREYDHHEAVSNRWRPLLYAVIAGETLPPVALPEKDWVPFCMTWLRLYEQVKGSSQEALIRALHQLDLRNRLLTKLRGNDTDDHLLALLMLGALREPLVIGPAHRMMNSRYELLSSVAARALLRVEPEAALPTLLGQLNRPGWSVARLVSKLLPVSSPIRRKHYLRAVDWVAEDQLPALLELVARTEADTFASVADRALHRQPYGLEILVTVLSHTRVPQHLKLAKVALGHPDSRLRLAALSAYQALGSLADIERILGALDDQAWQVQAAAARTLVSWPDMTPPDARQLLAALPADSRGRPYLFEAMYQKGWISLAIDPQEAAAHA